MTPGYSKVLFVDYIMTNGAAPLPMAGLDMMAMVAHASLERTEKQWRELLEAAELEVRRAWIKPDRDGLLEACLKQTARDL